jgi:Helix-turn-helix domain
VTVGESLTEARHQAGLSVDELSERTSIRGTVIRSIEHDDYEACGGDLYVRGYVRAIAGAVGIDAQSLLREYDETRASTGIGAFGPYLDATRFDLLPFPGDADATRFDLKPVSEDLMAAGYDLPPAGASVSAGPAAPVNRGHRARTGAAGRRARVRRVRVRGGGRGLLTAVAAVVLLAVAGTVGVRLASSSTTSRNTAATRVPKTVTSSAAAANTAATRAPAPKAPATQASATPQPATSATPTPSAVAGRVTARQPVAMLPIAAAEAFGPDGLADGDNPENAQYAIASDAPVPWSTQWYVTPQFGMLKHGTGLLLDLGRRATITSVHLDLSGYQGANLELRVGDTADPGDLKVAATATDVGGVVRLTLHRPASGRYLLVWFTLLPPDGAGHYAESVSGVLVNGRRS